jgi:hypothetical protein
MEWVRKDHGVVYTDRVLTVLVHDNGAERQRKGSMVSCRKLVRRDHGVVI